ncbi:MAG: hypothetical protein E6K56_09710, partial [Ignavibacteria bacterium]
MANPCITRFFRCFSFLRQAGGALPVHNQNLPPGGRETPKSGKSDRGKTKAWLAAADMGYGHMRAIYPLRDIAQGELLVLGINDGTTPFEEQLWKRMAGIYERFSRARRIPGIGKLLFQAIDAFQSIPSFYPIRNLSHSTFGVRLLESFIKRGLCSGLLSTIRQEHLPLVTSFYAAAIAAELKGLDDVYCIVCDADINRVWVAKEPWESKIIYFAPCGKAAQRLRAYGVPSERIQLTGFPLPHELLGGNGLSVLKADLGGRLHHLDPNNRFWPLHRRDVEHFLGTENCKDPGNRSLTLAYAVGGAGAQMDIGGKIAFSLKRRLIAGEIKLNLVAGTKAVVRDYFEEVREDLGREAGMHVTIVYAATPWEYFERFTEMLHTTDILWTKPSELSFYCALGVPIILSPAIGAQEYFNRQWLLEIQAGIRQENPEYTDQWLFDLLSNGRFA